MQGRVRVIAGLLLGLIVSACSIPSDECCNGAMPPSAIPEPGGASGPDPDPSAEGDGDAEPGEGVELDQKSAARFLIAATFGPTSGSIDELVELGYSDWYIRQLELPMRSIVEAGWADFETNNGSANEYKISLSEFLENSILGEDQLRMRAAYALSQIFVISVENEVIAYDGEGTARYMDILQEGALGNFRDLLEEVTYSPMMGEYLTYAGNKKADAEMGSQPDENYAREVMQLFTIGLYELNQDGSLKLDINGDPIETYSNEDITELAKVFTGLWWDGLRFGKDYRQRTQNAQVSRMEMHDDMHSRGSKTFLGRTIPDSGDGNATINAALDVLFEHPNVAPFISRQLIQRFTTSNPSPDYIKRVSDTFDAGRYELPSGDIVGDGRRGNLSAVWAAILFDEEYLSPSSTRESEMSKIREPFVRFAHWARMSGIPRVDMIVDGKLQDPLLFDMAEPGRLGQRPFTAPSVFNFYDPDFAVPGSRLESAGFVAPEMQITTNSAIVAYADYMRTAIYRDPGDGWQRGEFGSIGTYVEEIQLAEDTTALVDHLDLLLTAGTMSNATRFRVGSIIESIQLSDVGRAEKLRDRVQSAILFTVVSPEYLVQR
ncbi:MAG: DUF1800 family protein [Pseudomonadota bacterium]